ncbi:hypothetical protein LXT12_18130 [Pelomonas sp. P7]|uniref:Uncharacterized protein n=1 Tax=Pelomonas caseinilytica TaxID=2906763 RepID=A0ABS8XKR0_9BURK|nr:hypothetical protein [Pelomonas sp. P7]MCE4539174.1 hypothetical protein [Pelomonas sp. P7]
MDDITTTTKFSLPHRVKAWCGRQREAYRRHALRTACPRATEAASRIPAAVREAWRGHAARELPGLPVDDGAWLRCSIGLAQFFEACRLQEAHGPCALPSRAADSVWHAWLAFDPEGLAAWQQRHFGRVLDHVESHALGAPLEACLARSWAGACRSEGLSPLARRLPLLFALDGMLRVPTGWAYRHEGATLVHQPIDGFGQASGAAVAHAAVGAAALTAMSLVTPLELRARRRDDGAGASCGSSVASDGPGCSGDAGAGCDGGGSSCGSSCGGGCGGGG